MQYAFVFGVARAYRDAFALLCDGCILSTLEEFLKCVFVYMKRVSLTTSVAWTESPEPCLLEYE